MTFQCVNQTKSKKETWSGTITSLINYGSHFEIQIQSRSSILVLLGKTTLGNFACMPDFNAGCHLVSLEDRFWNMESLVRVIGKIDGITVAYALESIANKINL